MEPLPFWLQGGGYGEYAVTRPNQCVPLPTGLSLADGALIEPLAVALHGINLSSIRKGDKILVLGAGPIGLAVAFWAKRAGAASGERRSRSSDHHPHRVSCVGVGGKGVGAGAAATATRFGYRRVLTRRPAHSQGTEYRLRATATRQVLLTRAEFST